MSVTTLKVKKKLSKFTKNNKPWWSVLGEDEKWYSVWDEHVADQLQEGQQYNVGIETKGDFTTIKSIIPPSFLDGIQDVMPGAEEVQDQHMYTPPPPATPVQVIPPKPMMKEVAQIVEERMRAMDSATRMAAAGQLSPDISVIAGFANKLIEYYHGELK